MFLLLEQKKSAPIFIYSQNFIIDNLWFTCFFKRIVKLTEPQFWSKNFQRLYSFPPKLFLCIDEGDELQQLLEQNSTAPIIISSQTFRQGSLISYRELSY